jgi:hypothetical protein
VALLSTRAPERDIKHLQDQIISLEKSVTEAVDKRLEEVKRGIPAARPSYLLATGEILMHYLDNF